MQFESELVHSKELLHFYHSVMEKPPPKRGKKGSQAKLHGIASLLHMCKVRYYTKYSTLI
jgi:hypothetical protein